MKIKLLTISLLILLTTTIFGQSKQLYLKWDQNIETNLTGYLVHQVNFLNNTNITYSLIGTNIGATNTTYSVPQKYSTNGAIFCVFAYNSEYLLSLPSNLVTNLNTNLIIFPTVPKNPKVIKF